MTEPPQELAPAIRRGRIEQLTIYEVSESELETLERGSPIALYLNFSVFLLSVSASFLIALFTTTISSERTFTVFVVVTTLFLALGVLLLGLWFRSRVSIREVARRIRARVPPEGVPVSEG
jgi:hypothetical protein